MDVHCLPSNKVQFLLAVICSPKNNEQKVAYQEKFCSDI